MADKSTRCWICSSTLHHRSDCPARSAGGSGGGAAGSSGAGEMKDEKGGKSAKGKGGKENKGKGEFKGGGKTGINKVAANTTQVAGTTPESTPPTQPQQPSGDGKQADQGSMNSASGPQQETAGLVAEVKSLLKSMRVSQEDGARSSRGVMKPAISAVRLKRIEVGKESTVLLDGGATNCMRKAKSWKEHEEGVPVQVSLASGTAEMRQDRESGTLLVMQDVQPIVPISDLVKIGVRVEWSSTGCVMSHGGRRLPVYLDAGCPVIGLKEGMELMAQVEEFYKRRARLRVHGCGLGGTEPAGLGNGGGVQLCSGLSKCTSAIGGKDPREGALGSGVGAFEQEDEKEIAKGQVDCDPSVLRHEYGDLG